MRLDPMLATPSWVRYEIGTLDIRRKTIGMAAKKSKVWALDHSGAFLILELTTGDGDQSDDGHRHSFTVRGPMAGQFTKINHLPDRVLAKQGIFRLPTFSTVEVYGEEKRPRGDDLARPHFQHDAIR